MNAMLKTAIDVLISIYETVAPDDMEYFEINYCDSDSIRVVLAAYLCYLSISDGEISWDECETIEYYAGLNFDPSEIATFVEALGINTSSYANSIPLPLINLVNADNALFSGGQKLERYSSELFIEVLKGLAYELVISDGEVNSMETMSFYSYIAMVEEYVDSNLIARQV